MTKERLTTRLRNRRVEPSVEAPGIMRSARSDTTSRLGSEIQAREVSGRLPVGSHGNTTSAHGHNMVI